MNEIQTIPRGMEHFSGSDTAAVISRGHVITYRELIFDAKKIACRLCADGLQRGDRVLLEIENSVDYLRMWLGVIYAGGACVTLHRKWPEEMADAIRMQCMPSVVIDRKMAEEFVKDAREPEPECETFSVFPWERITGTDPFQIVYTSGSTGQPKGVVNCHQMAVGRVLDPDDTLACAFRERCRRLLVNCDLSFVLAGWLFVHALLNGKTVVLAGEDEILNVSALARLAAGTGVNVMHLNPFFFNVHAEHPVLKQVIRSLDLLITGSEYIPPSTAIRMREATDGQVIYTYGASELMGPFLECDADGIDMSRLETELSFYPPASCPEVYILDKDGRVSPENEEGELCIGGIYAAQGAYWLNPELTEEKYRTHGDRGRLYHTGDMAIRDSEGAIRIVGRLDSMVKLHGNRIETRAVEQAMLSFPGIRQAAVKLSGSGIYQQLAGYYTAETSPDQAALRQMLSRKLPPYMIPSRFVELEHMPSNANGKLDYSRLPGISPGRIQKRGGLRLEGNDRFTGYNETKNMESEGIEINTILELTDRYREDDRIMILCGDEQISCRDFIRGYQRLARQLISLGVKKSDRVLLCRKRGIPYLTGLFGILASGAAYVHTDPEWPQSRREAILRDSEAVFILTDEEILDDKGTPAARKQIPEDAPKPRLPQLSGEDPCCIYYTSGSTGVPKGSEIAHEVLLNNALHCDQNVCVSYTLSHCKTVLSLLNMTYSFVLFHVMSALGNGLRLILASEEESRSAEAIGSCMERHHADALSLTPSLLERFLEDPVFSRAFGSVKTVLLSGEALTEEQISTFAGKTQAVIFNGYGSSETLHLSDAVCKAGEVPHIGTPTLGVEFHVLDEYMQSVQEGESGVLYIGGTPARNGHYLKRGDLDAEKYILHPSFGRLFCTGDGAVLLEGGSVRLTGRIDETMKLFAFPTVRQLAQMMVKRKADTKHSTEEAASNWQMDLSEEEREAVLSQIPENLIQTVRPYLPTMVDHALDEGDRNWLVYHLGSFESTDPLDMKRLQRRYDEMVRCRQALRSFFVIPEKGRPLIVVRKEAKGQLFYRDLHKMPRGQQYVHIRAFLRAFRMEGFPEGDAMVQTGFFRIRDHEYWICILMSHYVLDNIGYQRVVKDLMGSMPILPDDREMDAYYRNLYGEFAREGRTHWKSLTKGLSGYTLLGKDGADINSEPPGQLVPSNETLFASILDRDDRFESYLKKNQVTTAAFFHTVLGMALAKLNGSKQAVFLSVGGGRMGPMTEDDELTGMFSSDFPFVYKEGDTTQSIQNQLLTGTQYCTLALENREGPLARPGARIGVVKLNIYNFKKTDDIEDSTLYFIFDYNQMVPGRRDKGVTIYIVPAEKLELSFNFRLDYVSLETVQKLNYYITESFEQLLSQTEDGRE